MDDKPKVFEWMGYTIALATLIFSVFYYYMQSADLYFSTIGAIFTALLVWMSYIIIRLLLISAR